MTRKIGKGRNTKDFILRCSLNLFSTHPYDSVTFSKLAELTKLTVGALSYHFNTKEQLFCAMCDKYFPGKDLIISKLNEKTDEDTGLKEFIDIYIESLNELKLDFAKFGIINLDLALFNITNEAKFHYPGFIDRVIQWHTERIEAWENICLRAEKKSEIKNDICPKARPFDKLYVGCSRVGIYERYGIDVFCLREYYDAIYQLIVR